MSNSGNHPFKLGDRVKLKEIYKASPMVKIGDIGVVIHLGFSDSRPFVDVEMENSLKSDGSKCIVHGCYAVRWELVEEVYTPTSMFPEDVFDPRYFYTKEWQEANWQSSTGSAWKYKDKEKDK